MPSPEAISPHRSTAADGIPAILLDMQSRQEAQFIALKQAESRAIVLLGRRPQPFVLPARPSLPKRALMRLLPPLARRWQLRALRQSGMFDAGWYLEKYPDVKAAGADPARHFLRWGLRDLRDPGPGFSTAHYLQLYPDVQAAGLNPLVHYLTSGWAEGRSTHPQMPERLG